jgi:hypothetical protein
MSRCKARCASEGMHCQFEFRPNSSPYQNEELRNGIFANGGDLGYSICYPNLGLYCLESLARSQVREDGGLFGRTTRGGSIGVEGKGFVLGIFCKIGM